MDNQLPGFPGKVVLITGAVTGIGRANARAFAAAGAAVVIGDPGMAPSVAAKHAVAGLTKAAAIDDATQGIRVNAIAPGLVRTPMTERWLADPRMRDKVLADSPIRRAAEPEDIAGLVLFLASDLASISTGAVYPIDGARTAH